MFDTADDNIAIKAGRDQDAWGGRSCENIVVCRGRGIRSGANAYRIGCEMSGGVRNVYILDSSSGVAKGLLCIKSNSDRGGMVENVWARGIQADACDFCIQMQTDYKGVKDHPYPPDHRNLHFQDIHCRKVWRTGISSVGIRAKPIGGVYLRSWSEKSVGDSRRI